MFKFIKTKEWRLGQLHIFFEPVSCGESDVPFDVWVTLSTQQVKQCHDSYFR